jgi:hypothetical protein
MRCMHAQGGFYGSALQAASRSSRRGKERPGNKQDIAAEARSTSNAMRQSNCSAEISSYRTVAPPAAHILNDVVLRDAELLTLEPGQTWSSVGVDDFSPDPLEQRTSGSSSDREMDQKEEEKRQGSPSKRRILGVSDHNTELMDIPCSTQFTFEAPQRNKFILQLKRP